MPHKQIEKPADFRVCLNLPIGEHRQLPDTSAVYIVFEPPDTVLYIGHSRRLRSRWSGRRVYKTFKTNPELHIAWYPFPPTQLRDAEKTLIRVYKPERNVQLNKQVEDFTKTNGHK